LDSGTRGLVEEDDGFVPRSLRPAGWVAAWGPRRSPPGLRRARAR